jgi:hypothetical protein
MKAQGTICVPLTRKEAASRFGIGMGTLIYYEKEGLLPALSRIWPRIPIWANAIR